MAIVTDEITSVIKRVPVDYANLVSGFLFEVDNQLFQTGMKFVK
jgi:hypothetical protein